MTLSTTITTNNSTPLFPVADADGDVGNLADVIGGPGTSSVFDPGEASESGETPALFNVNGQGEDLSGLLALHGGTAGTPAMTTSEFTQALTISLAGGLGGAATAAAQLLRKNFFGAIGAGVGSYSAFKSEANTILDAYKQALIQKDPFDPNFTQVYTPVAPPPLAIPPFDAGTTLTASQQAALTTDITAALTAGAQVTEFTDAAYNTQNRLFSAYQQSDLASFTLQNTTLNSYVDTLAKAETALGAADKAWANDMTADGLNVATVTAADVTALQAQLKTQGLAALPPDEQAMIVAAFPALADQQAILTALEQVDPTQVPTSFVAALQQEASNASQLGTALTLPVITSTTVPPLLSPAIPTPTPAPTATHFDIIDTTTGATLPDTFTPYPGPVAGIQWQCITTTTDNLAITAITPNSFIHTGSGTDAIDVSKVNGTNVLDGSTGSNFLVGGTGFDTFFVDDRIPTADVFSTVSGFHSGDNATIFGVTAADFKLQINDNQGATGFQGLDFGFSAAGKPNANLVLTGFTSADLNNGRLTTSFGTNAATANAPASTFMLIHAN
jgi:hypothetical protein